MRIGVDYYPEHWERERWKTDIELMHQAGIEIVRIGEFDWSLYEPKEADYQFGWMDEILDFMQENQMKVVLGTPSATPPKWMTDRYGDEIYQADLYGHSKLFGTRKHYCFNSEVYRQKIKALTEKIASRYAKHPAIEDWQIDNELGWANTTRCYCSKCEKKFKKYLQKKYGTIENLNRTYGTVFWSQTYNSFEEVIIPRAGACYDTCHDTQGQNPSLLLDYDRFSSESVIDFMTEQADIIRKYSDKPITTNMLDAAVNSGTGIDYFKMSKPLDFVTWDNYIEFQWGIAKDETVSRDHALLRSYKHQPFWVMEQQSGPCGWSKMGPTPTPGKLRLWTYQAVAAGSDTVVYFRWRACPFGTEEYWHGILGHDGKPNRRFEEISKIGSEMKKLSRTFGALQPKAKVAIIKSFDSEWSHEIHKHVEGFHYDSLLLDYYRAFYRMGIPVEFTAPEEDLSSYKLVLAPALLMVDAQQKKNLEHYVENGGSLLLSFRSGVKTMENTFLTNTVPGDFAELTGIEVYEYDPQFEKETEVSGVFGNGKAKLWCDVITPLTAKVLGRYNEDFYAETPCLTRNNYGEGNAYYLGCDLEEDAMLHLMQYLCRQTGLETEPFIIEGVERVPVTDGKTEALFVMNHNTHSVTVPLDRQYTEMLSDTRVQDTIYLKAFDVAVLKPL